MSSSSDIDDLARLASQTGFDRSVYKTFRTTRHELPPAPAAKSEIAARSDTAPGLLSIAENPRTRRPESDAAEVIAQPLQLKNLAQFSRGARWAGLEVALGSLAQNAGSNSVEPRRSRPSSLFVGGVASGTGTTTVVASLARLWSQRGEQVTILDTSADPLLPLYFGGRTTTLPVSNFVFSGDPGRGAIHAFRGTGDLQDIADTASARCFDSLVEQSDRFLIDAGAGAVRDSSKATPGVSIHIITVVPDTRCLAALARLENRVSTSDAGSAAPLLLLLNQFDASDSMHLEIRSRLASRFPGRLVPLEIRRDRQVAAALGAGTTVVDYAPASTAAQDLMRLSQWLANGNLHNSVDELSHFAGAFGN
jgi:cellulose biosynthesis protein BcsQ